jgi:hypothetical protein
VLAEKGRSNAGRTRHINIRYYFVKDKIEAEEVQVKYIPTEDMWQISLRSHFRDRCSSSSFGTSSWE